MFINDTFRKGFPAEDSSLWESTEVGDGVSIGSNATILPVRIGAGSVIGAGAVVTRDVPPGVVVAGNPATVVRRLGLGDS
jgi:acetyltransferase-like isoleucine patch superfamily enzyme